MEPPTIIDSDDRFSRLTADVKTAAGTVLMTLGYYRKNTWFVLYSRRDFEESYTDVDQRKIADDAIFDGLTKHTKERIWKAGDLDYVISKYTDAIVIHVSLGETEGIVLGLDRVPLRDLARIINRCLAFRDTRWRGREPGST